MDSESIEATAAQWFAKLKGDHWTEVDQSRLDAWLDSATAHRVAFLRLNAAWQHSARLKALGAGVAPGVIPPRHFWTFSSPFERQPTVRAASADSCLIPASAPLEKRLEVKRSSLYSALAASLLLIVTVGAAWYWSSDKADAYHTAVGSTDIIPLTDGSRITLNTNSRIRVALNETERRIELDRGEAFFIVAKDSVRPFTVVAGEKRVVAVGTKFSVRREANDVRIIVTEGRVKLEEGADGGIPATQLDAGAVATTKDSALRVQQRPLPDVEQLLSWRSGYLTFRDTALSEAVSEFNRYSARKMAIEDPEIAHIRIGGNFRIDNAEAFLWLLQNGFPINVEQGNDRIILTAR